MPPGKKLSSDNELNYKYILMFTIAFVVIALIIMAAGYALLTATGILGPTPVAADPTPTPGPATPTHRPTYEVIILPTEVPCPTPTPIPPTPTPTPSPTPVPSPVKINIDESQAGSYRYLVYISLVPGSQPLDMTHVRLKIWDYEKTYCDYSYDEAMYNLWGVWSPVNSSPILDPGETLLFEVSDNSLDIPYSRETTLELYYDNILICHTPLPALLTTVDPNGQPYNPYAPVDTSGQPFNPYV